MTSYIRDQAEGLPADDEDIRVLSEFYAAALSGLTALWLQNGMKYDTDAYIDHLGHSAGRQYPPLLWNGAARIPAKHKSIHPS